MNTPESSTASRRTPRPSAAPTSTKRRRGAPVGNQNGRIGPTPEHARALVALGRRGLSMRAACTRLALSRMSVIRWRQYAPWFRHAIADAFNLG